jgi:hypothetical protein
MRGLSFKQPLVWLILFLALACLFGAAYGINAWKQNERAREASEAVSSDLFLEKNGIVNMSVTRVERSRIKDKPAESIAWVERLPVYGQVVPNPRASTEVRMAFAGTLRAVTESPWPAPGQWLHAGQVLGRIEIRVGPQERLDWQGKLAEARLKQQGAEEILKIEQARIDRFKSVGAADIVSRRELDDALVRYAEAKTQLAAAQSAVKLWQEALAQSDKPGNGPTLWNHALTVPADGEVTELLCRPGTVVEAGTVVLRLVDFRRPLVRLDLPPLVLMAGPPRQVSLGALGAAPAALSGITNRAEAGRPVSTIPANIVGAAPQVEASSQLASYWYEVVEPIQGEKGGDGRAWRPGLFVKAEVALPGGKQQPAVAVPATSLLFHQGRALVYVRLDPGRYQRREVQILGRDGERWVLASGVQPGEPVVFEQAQILLSQEFNTDND